MAKMKDFTGQIFGRLTALSPVKVEGSYHYYWKCQCICGNVVIVVGYALRNGSTKSCGCLQKERVRERNITHGLCNSSLYMTWKNIKDRCFNDNNPQYKNYGGRDITVCERWMDFKNFYDDMLPTYQKGLSIDRIDNDGNYEPKNCRWSTMKEQQNNRRNNHILDFDGRKLTLSQWAEELGFNLYILDNRINRHGWSIEKALITPVKCRSKIE